MLIEASLYQQRKVYMLLDCITDWPNKNLCIHDNMRQQYAKEERPEKEVWRFFVVVVCWFLNFFVVVVADSALFKTSLIKWVNLICKSITCWRMGTCTLANNKEWLPKLLTCFIHNNFNFWHVLDEKSFQSCFLNSKMFL